MDISEMMAVIEASHQHIKNQEKEIEKLKKTVATWQSKYAKLKTEFDKMKEVMDLYEN